MAKEKNGETIAHTTKKIPSAIDKKLRSFFPSLFINRTPDVINKIIKETKKKGNNNTKGPKTIKAIMIAKCASKDTTDRIRTLVATIAQDRNTTPIINVRRSKKNNKKKMIVRKITIAPNI